MKLTFRNILKGAMALSLALFVGCKVDDPNFANPDVDFIPGEGNEPGDENSGDGYLSFDEMMVSINTENEIFGTRSGSFAEASDDYLVYVHKETTGEQVYCDTYANTKNLTDNLILPVGNYKISARSIAEVPAAGWDAPHYRSIQRTVSIGADKTTDVGAELVCTMSNIKTTVSMSADLKALFKTGASVDKASGDVPLETILELGDAKLTYGEDESRAGYFAEQEGDSSIAVTLRGMYNTAAADETPTYAPIEWKQNISGVAAGQWRDIKVEIANYNEGILTIKFVVTTWVYDATLGVKMSQAFYTPFEDEIYDPDSEASDPYSPTITVEGGEGLDYYIYPEAFDNVNLAYSPLFKAVMTPQSGSSVAEAIVMLSSTNVEYLAAMEAKGYASKPLWDKNGANADVADTFILNYDDASGVLTSEITYEAMKMMSDYRGIHTLKYIVKDDQNRRSVTNVIVHAVASNKLDIVWREGEDGTQYSFDDEHEIGSNIVLPVVFDMTSKKGITKLLINITSSILTPAELGTLGLAQNMDLINPATDKMADQLRTLGFPVGDEIDGATELVFNITSFMPVLAGLSEDKGTTDKSAFTITLGDDTGDCVKVLNVIGGKKNE